MLLLQHESDLEVDLVARDVAVLYIFAPTTSRSRSKEIRY
jgi:hypothetical protein